MLFRSASEDHSNRAVIRLALDDRAGARADAFRALELIEWGDVTDIKRTLYLGGLLSQLGEFDAALDVAERVLALGRSEERRGGKECRARWWPDH